MQILNRAEGVLTGLALGDAAGMPFEMMYKEKIRKIRADGQFFYEIPDDSFLKRDLKRAEVTDDTLLTMHLAEFLLTNDIDFSKEDYFSDLAEYINTNNLITKGIIGPSTGRTIMKISRNENITLSERAGFSSGLPMKVTPLGIIFDIKDQGKILDTLEKLAYYSHYTDSAVSAAAGVTAFISSALSGSSIEQIFDDVLEFMQNAESCALKTFQPSSYQRVKFLYSYLEKFEHNKDSLNFLSEVIGTGINSYEVVPAALMVFKLFSNQPLKAIDAAVELGGDTDTIAALTGSFTGAYNGISSFEEGPLAKLSEVNEFDFKNTAEKLLELKQN
jgi:ADP-ribosylglycohydrolase